MEKQDVPAAVPASTGDPVEAVERANVLVRAVLAGLLQRKRSIAAALMCILALGRDVRANCWDLSEKVGLEPGDDAFRRLLERYRWSWERGRGMLPGLAQQALGAGPDADDEIGPGLAIDETTGLKRGTATACVSPQHTRCGKPTDRGWPVSRPHGGTRDRCIRRQWERYSPPPFSPVEGYLYRRPSR